MCVCVALCVGAGFVFILKAFYSFVFYYQHPFKTCPTSVPAKVGSLSYNILKCFNYLIYGHADTHLPSCFCSLLLLLLLFRSVLTAAGAEKHQLIHSRCLAQTLSLLCRYSHTFVHAQCTQPPTCFATRTHIHALPHSRIATHSTLSLHSLFGALISAAQG